MGCTFCDDFKQWWAAPFRADMNAKDWALFMGFVIVVFAGWHMVFRHIKGFEA
jgi:hypothetical protein